MAPRYGEFEFSKGGHVSYGKKAKASKKVDADGDDDCYARGGAARGMPASRRKGHPMPGKKPVMGKARPAVGAAAGNGTLPPTGLAGLTAGSMGSGPGEVAMPQGQVPLKKGGRPKR